MKELFDAYRKERKALKKLKASIGLSLKDNHFKEEHLDIAKIQLQVEMMGECLRIACEASKDEQGYEFRKQAVDKLIGWQDV